MGRLTAGLAIIGLALLCLGASCGGIVNPPGRTCKAHDCDCYYYSTEDPLGWVYVPCPEPTPTQSEVNA